MSAIPASNVTDYQAAVRAALEAGPKGELKGSDQVKAVAATLPRTVDAWVDTMSAVNIWAASGLADYSAPPSLPGQGAATNAPSFFEIVVAGAQAALEHQEGVLTKLIAGKTLLTPVDYAQLQNEAQRSLRLNTAVANLAPSVREGAARQHARTLGLIRDIRS